MTSPEALGSFLEASKLGFSVETVRLRDSHPWKYIDGALSHESGGFFSVVGIEFTTHGDKGVFLYQPQSALTGLLSTTRDGQRHFLLQARAEPGTHGSAQYGPTVQSTPANYLRMHGGRVTPYVEYLSLARVDAVPYGDSVQLDLGERYFAKSKRHILIDCHGDVEVLPNYVWVPSSVIKSSLLKSSFFNIDLRAFFSVMPWEAALGTAPNDPDMRTSALSQPRPEVLGHMLAGLHSPPPKARFVGLETLDDWKITDWGLFEREPRAGYSIEFYQVNAPSREVVSWMQPLVNSTTTGRAALCCRRRSRGGFEVLVRIARERGLSTGAALAPSILRYPGDATRTRQEDTIDATCPSVLARTLESDEGGRFYNDVSVYELLLVPGEGPALEGGDTLWLTLGELKVFLAASNFCSIQLRGLASMLLGVGAC